MTRWRRVSPVSFLAIIAVVMIAFALLFTKPSMSQAGGEFMDALVRGNVDKLVSLTDMDGTPDEIHKKWEQAVNVSGKHYDFAWTITGDTQSDANNGSVRLSVKRNVNNPSTYDENFQLPMHMVDGKWKVRVGEINFQMYPGLPRG